MSTDTNTDAAEQLPTSRIRREHSWMTRFLGRLQITRFFENDPVQEAEDYYGNWDDLVNEANDMATSRMIERDELQKQVETMQPVASISKDGFAVVPGDTVYFLPDGMNIWRHGVVQNVAIGKATGKMGARIRFKILGSPSAYFEHKLVSDCYKDKSNVPEDGAEG